MLPREYILDIQSYKLRHGMCDMLEMISYSVAWIICNYDDIGNENVDRKVI